MPALDTTPTTHHRVIIGGLQDGQKVRFVALARRLYGGACITEVSDPVEVTIHVSP